LLLPETFEPARYVLVVGADSDDRAWLEGVLMSADLRVAAVSPGELLAAPDILAPQIVFFDDKSSRIPRRDVIRRAVRVPALTAVPFVVLAYDRDIDSFSEAVTGGAAAYLVKPTEPTEVVDVARKLIGWAEAPDHSEKRRRLRRPLLLRVDIDLRSERRTIPGRLVDVSDKGCQVETAEPLGQGDAVRVVLRGLEDTTHLALGAVVRWTQPEEDSFSAGLRFSGTTALLAGKLLGFAKPGIT
jgi:CheY-like chemotaxis protein